MADYVLDKYYPRVVLDLSSAVAPLPPDPPEVAIVSPAPGSSIDGDDLLVFDVTVPVGSAFRRIIVAINYPGYRTTELVHDGDAFTVPYQDASTREVIANGYRFSVRRSPVWPASPTLTVYAFDTSGGENA